MDDLRWSGQPLAGDGYECESDNLPATGRRLGKYAIVRVLCTCHDLALSVIHGGSR